MVSPTVCAGPKSGFASMRKLKITAEEVGLLNERGRGIPCPRRSVSGTRCAQEALGRAAGRSGHTASRRSGRRRADMVAYMIMRNKVAERCVGCVEDIYEHASLSNRDGGASRNPAHRLR